MAPVLDPVQQLADECRDFEEFLQRLPELLGESGMDTTALVRKLAEGTFKARGFGEADNGDT